VFRLAGHTKKSPGPAAKLCVAFGSTSSVRHGCAACEVVCPTLGPKAIGFGQLRVTFGQRVQVSDCVGVLSAAFDLAAPAVTVQDPATQLPPCRCAATFPA
jgi:hypothetical protein